MRVRLLCQLRLHLLLAAFSLIPVYGQTGVLEGFNDYVNNALRDWKIPGAAIVIVKNDSVVLCRGYGVRHIEGQTPVDENTLFGIASCSKAFTSASLAMLVDEGKIAWDDQVVKFLPWFQMYDPYVTRELRIRDLLTHRSGLPEYGGDLMWWGASRSREEILQRIRSVQPASSFRSRYAYSNIMFIAAGQIILAVTDTSWEDFVKERILVPLDMRSSTTSFASLRRAGNVATPHMVVDGIVRPIAWRNVDNGGPAGGINSNASDLARWIQLQLGHGTYNGKKLFSDQASNEMWSPQMVIPIGMPSPTDAQPIPHFRAYGLGWGISDYRDRKIIRHFGETDGMSSVVALIPEENLGVAILTNMHVASMHNALVFRIADLFLGPPMEDWNLKFLEAQKQADAQSISKRKKLEDARTKGTGPSLPLQSYVGTYENAIYGVATIEEKGGHLVVRLGTTHSAIADLEHWHFDTFEAKWQDPVFEKGFVIFYLNGQGGVDRMSLRVAEYVEPTPYTFTRVPATTDPLSR